MKRFLQILWATMLVALTGVQASFAQTDVTDQYLTNADYSQDTPIATNLKGYGKDMGSGATAYGFQPVIGWTSTVVSGDNSNSSYPNSGMGGAVFAYGSSYQVQGNSKTPPASGPDGNAGQCLAIFGVWGCGGYYYQEVSFPAGEYTINIPVYNQSGTNATTTYFGFIPNSGTSQTIATPTSTGSWRTLTKTFTLTTATTGKICVGYKSNGSGSGANPMLFIDKVQILYTAMVIKDDLATALTYATRANAGLNDSNLTSALASAQSVYDSTTASQADVDNAIASLKAATATAIQDTGLTDLNFLLQNADFSSTTGWTAYVSDSFKDYGYGSIGTSLASYAASTTDATHLSSEYHFGFECRWSTNYSSYNQSLLVLPAGNYNLSFDVENRNSSTTSATYENLFYVKAGNTTIGDTSTEWMSGATDWTTHSVPFTLTETTEVLISLGYGTGSNNFGQGNTPVLYVSHFNLSKVSDAQALAAAKAEWDAALAAAEAAYANVDYSNVNGKERADLETEIAKAEPTTIEGYETATAALNAATSAFIAAKANWDALENEIGKAFELGVSTTDAEDVAADQTTTAADALTATQALKVAEYNYVSTNFPYGVELGTWQSSGTNTTAAEFSNEHWSGTSVGYLNQNDSNGQGWNANSWTLDVYQDVELPDGNYVFKAAGRIATSGATTVSLTVKDADDNILGSVDDFPHNGSGARGITTTGVTSFNPNDTFANNGNGFGWEWRYVRFTLSQTTTVRVAISAVATASHEWFSISDYTVQTDNQAGFALIEYNVALANAQTVLNSETFSDPSLLSTEKDDLIAAIAADATLDKTDADAIEAATLTLQNATATYQAAVPSYNHLAGALGLARTLQLSMPSQYSQLQTVIDMASSVNLASDAESCALSLESAMTDAEAFLDAYNKLADEINYASSFNVNVDDAYNVMQQTDQTGALTDALTDLKALEYTTVTTDYPTDVTSLLGTWTANGFREKQSGQHFNGTNSSSYYDNWNMSTGTLSQTVNLPAGNYVLVAPLRGTSPWTMAAGTTSIEPTLQADKGIGINLNGECSYDSSDAAGFARSGEGYGWEFRYLPFTVSATGDVTLSLSVNTSNSNWASVDETAIKLLAENGVIVLADANDYSDLASAIANAEGYVLGFDANEYAPYNNVAALQALAAAKAIDPNAVDGNRQDIVQGVTATLNAANWTANTAEVNGIYNGDWALSTPNAETGVDVDVPGWTPNVGIRKIIADEDDDPGLAYTSAGKALFTWQNTTITYGEQVGYTLPLNGNTIYVFKMKLAGWRDGDMPTSVSLTIDGTSAMMDNFYGSFFDRVNTTNIYADGPFTEVSFMFQPNDDGDYVLNLWTDGHYVVSDMSLFKAPTITVDEDAAYNYYQKAAAGYVQLKRTINANKYNAVVLPFDMSQTDVEDFFGEGSKVTVVKNYDNAKTHLAFTTQQGIVANRPCLVYATQGGTQFSIPTKFLQPSKFVDEYNTEFFTDAPEYSDTENTVTMTGTYAQTVDIPDNSWFIQGGNLVYAPAGTRCYIKNTRAYITLNGWSPESAAKALTYSFEDGETGIATIENGELNFISGKVYDLSGRAVSNPTKGVYIVNGKKVVIK